MEDEAFAGYDKDIERRKAQVNVISAKMTKNNNQPSAAREQKQETTQAGQTNSKRWTTLAKHESIVRISSLMLTCSSNGVQTNHCGSRLPTKLTVNPPDSESTVRISSPMLNSSSNGVQTNHCRSRISSPMLNSSSNGVQTNHCRSRLPTKLTEHSESTVRIPSPMLTCSSNGVQTNHCGSRLPTKLAELDGLVPLPGLNETPVFDITGDWESTYAEVRNNGQTQCDQDVRSSHVRLSTSGMANSTRQYDTGMSSLPLGKIIWLYTMTLHHTTMAEQYD
ncbi:hypothetical protein J6590_048224 [Homalodisca vitripennis]|nr:hypothetical protein J6590_048224 [Homalodisca vitripennis]